MLFLVKMSNGLRLIVKEETEILIPKSMREEMTRFLHSSHQADIAMMTQAKNHLLRNEERPQKDIRSMPNMSREQNLKANEGNEISQENIFENFIPGQQVELDYAEKGCNNYLMIACSLTGFIRHIKPQTKGQMRQSSS